MQEKGGGVATFWLHKDTLQLAVSVKEVEAALGRRRKDVVHRIRAFQAIASPEPERYPGRSDVGIAIKGFQLRKGILHSMKVRTTTQLAVCHSSELLNRLISRGMRTHLSMISHMEPVSRQ